MLKHLLRLTWNKKKQNFLLILEIFFSFIGLFAGFTFVLYPYNNYKLPLYMDVRDPATKKNPAVSSFDVKGIPAKFVIDGSGKIRFKTAGFGGTKEALVNELSAMIELSRQAS